MVIKLASLKIRSLKVIAMVTKHAGRRIHSPELHGIMRIVVKAPAVLTRKATTNVVACIRSRPAQVRSNSRSVVSLVAVGPMHRALAIVIQKIAMVLA